MFSRIATKVICALLTALFVFGATSVDFRLAYAGQLSASPFSSKDMAAKIAPFVSINSEGLFVFEIKDLKAVGLSRTEYRAVKRYFAELNGHLSAYPVNERPILKGVDGKVKWNNAFKLDPQIENGTSSISVAYAAGCVTIPKWVLQAFGWAGVLASGYTGVLGGAVAGTILGVPVAIIIGLLAVTAGTTWGLYLTIVDANVPPSGLNVCW